MKTKFILFLTWLASMAGLSATAVQSTTAVHARASDNAPVISYLKAGSAPVFATSTPAPAGWAAVELEGPFESYIMRKDLNKSLDPRPGAEIHLLPDPASPVLTVAEKGDKADITGQFRGKWTQINLTKKIVGYIRVGNSAVLAPVLTDTVAPAPAAPLDPAPVPTSAHGFAGPGKPAPMVNLGDGGSASLPRAIQGRFVSSKRPFAPRRPFDYQINDDAGVRYAYLDLSKLLLTEAPEKYIDRLVIVYGTARTLPGTKDVVIEVETLQLR